VTFRDWVINTKIVSPKLKFPEYGVPDVSLLKCLPQYLTGSRHHQRNRIKGPLMSRRLNRLHSSARALACDISLPFDLASSCSSIATTYGQHVFVQQLTDSVAVVYSSRLACQLSPYPLAYPDRRRTILFRLPRPHRPHRPLSILSRTTMTETLSQSTLSNG
jgi:hypothetical protein